MKEWRSSFLKKGGEQVEEETNGKDGIKRLNVDVPVSIKKRLGEFCLHHDVTIKYAVVMALEGFLDAMETKKQ